MARPPTRQERQLAGRLNQREARRQYRRGDRRPRASFGNEVPGEWADNTPCDGQTTLFYSYLPADEIAAKAICAGCPAIDPCRTYARRNREFGTWGGETELERARNGRGNPLMVGNAAKAHYAAGGLQ